MSLAIQHEVLDLPLRDPFRIARAEHGSGLRVTTFVLELTDDRFPGVVGLGEGYPGLYYGETVATVPAILPLLLGAAGEPEPSAAWLLGASRRIEESIVWKGDA